MQQNCHCEQRAKPAASAVIRKKNEELQYFLFKLGLQTLHMPDPWKASPAWFLQTCSCTPQESPCRKGSLPRAQRCHTHLDSPGHARGPHPSAEPLGRAEPREPTELQRPLEHYKQPAILAAQELCDRSELLFLQPQAMKLNLPNLLASFLLVSLHTAARGGPGRLKLTELVTSRGVKSPAH